MQTKRYSFIWRFVGLLACLIMVRTNAREPIQITAKPIFEAPSEVTLRDGTKVTYNAFRIPSLARTNNGTLIAVCEGRTKEEAGAIGNGTYLNDKYARSDLVMRKSSDGGNTWSPITTLIEGTINPNADGWRDMYSNATQVVDYTDSIDPRNPKPAVYLHFNKWIGGQGPGSVWELDKTGAVINKSSNGNESWVMGFDNNGLTSDNENFRPRKLDDVPEGLNWRVAYGPGSGVQLSTGRLIVPASYTAGSGFEVFSLYSDDHGSTWHRGLRAPYTLVPEDQSQNSLGSENQLVVLENGTVYLQARPAANKTITIPDPNPKPDCSNPCNIKVNQADYQIIRTSKFDTPDIPRDPNPSTQDQRGAHWEIAANRGMKLPQVQTAIKRYTLQNAGDDKNRILWTGPTNYTPKVNPDPYNLSIRVSKDETKDFTEARLYELTSRKLWDGVAWYSDMAIDKNKNFVGVLFEGHGLPNAPAITDDTIYFTAVNRAFLEPPAGLIAWEPFTYNRYAVNDTGDGTKDGGLGWTTGWSTDVAIPHTGGMPPELIENSDLFYGSNYPFTNQGSRRLYFGSTGGSLARAFNPMIDLGKTQAYYVSMLVRIDGQYSDNLDIGLFSGITRGVGFGLKVVRPYRTSYNPPPAPVFKITVNGGNTSSEQPLDLSFGKTFMVVFKVAAAANSATAEYIYAKVYKGEAIPLHETTASGFGGWDVAVKSGVDANMKMDRILITAGTAAGFLIDDLRIGTTWEAVVSNQE